MVDLPLLSCSTVYCKQTTSPWIWGGGGGSATQRQPSGNFLTKTTLCETFGMSSPHACEKPALLLVLVTYSLLQAASGVMLLRSFSKTSYMTRQMAADQNKVSTRPKHHRLGLHTWQPAAD